MKPARQLQLMGAVLLFPSLMGAAFGLGGGLLVWKGQPYRTIGVHGMLPATFHSDVLAVLLACAGALSLLVALLAWALYRTKPERPWSALGVGVLVCGFAVYSTRLEMLPAPPIVIPVLGSYLVATAIASWVDTHPAARIQGRLRKVLERPMVSGAAIALLVSVTAFTVAVLFPSATQQQFRDLAGQRKAPHASDTSHASPPANADDWKVCSQSDRLSEFCGGVTALAITGTGERIASAAVSTQVPIVSLWDRASGKQLWSTRVEAHNDSVQAMSFSADGRGMIVATRSEAWLISTERGEIVRSLERCAAPEKTDTLPRARIAAAFAPNGKELAVGGDGLCITDLQTGAVVRRFAADVCSAVESLAYSLDGKTLSSLCSGHVRLWDTNTFAQLGELPFGTHNDPLRVEPEPGSAKMLRFSRDEARILTRNESNGTSLWLWNAATRVPRHVTQMNMIYGSSEPPIELLPDSRRALLGGKPLRLIDAETGETRRTLLDGSDVVALAQPRDQPIVVAGLAVDAPSTRASIVVLDEAELGP